MKQYLITTFTNSFNKYIVGVSQDKHTVTSNDSNNHLYNIILEGFFVDGIETDKDPTFIATNIREFEKVIKEEVPKDTIAVAYKLGTVTNIQELL